MADTTAVTSGRIITVVLCDHAGDVLGALPPFVVPTRWWPETAEAVAHVRAAHGLDVTILRLMATDAATPGPGVHTTVLAEVSSSDPLPAPLALDAVPPRLLAAVADHPLRQAYARPGGPQADIAWADEALRRAGRPRIGRPEQRKTWNLSSIWRLPTAAGPVWLKSVPSFFAHEGAMIAALADVKEVVPPLLAHDRQRVLLDDVAGTDLHDASGPELMRMVTMLVNLQADVVDRADDLLATGCFDWRAPALLPMVNATLERSADMLDRRVRGELAALVKALPTRLRQIHECGIPDTLVHGDFHPGNVRGDDARLTLLDWGDSGVGHPMLDQPAFLDRVPAADRDRFGHHWRNEWLRAAPGCDPERASDLLRPVSALRQAVLYQLFLDRIEPTERVYHAADPLAWLVRAAEERTGGP